MAPTAESIPTLAIIRRRVGFGTPAPVRVHDQHRGDHRAEHISHAWNESDDRIEADSHPPIGIDRSINHAIFSMVSSVRASAWLRTTGHPQSRHLATGMKLSACSILAGFTSAVLEWFPVCLAIVGLMCG